MNHFYDAEEHGTLIGLNKDMENDFYHGEAPGISSSVVKTMGKSPQQCYARHFDPKRERDESAALIFGTQAHTFMLENHKFFDENALIPGDINRRTNAGKAEWAAFEASNAGKQFIKKDDFDMLVAMREELYAHPAARMFLEEQMEIEWSGFWVDDETGLICKYRPDARAASGAWIMDYKTTNDASSEAFGRASGNFGYHNSAAWYTNGDKVVRGVSNQKFAFIAQEKTAPYAVAVYVMDPDAIELGRRQNKHWMRLLADCLSSDRWAGYNDDQVSELYLPPWIMKALG